jgi:hypothetical protein
MTTPTLDEFLHAPLEQVAAVAPTTLIYAPGGTRRQAALAGIGPDSDAYPRWSAEHMRADTALLFQYGVRHVFMTILQSPQFAEVGRYRERLMAWLAEGVAGNEALADYARHGWRVRLVGAERLPELQETVERLYDVTPTQWTQTLWFYVSDAPGAHWTTVLEAGRQGARTQAEAIRAIYGEDIPPATLLLAFGKPLAGADIFPVLLSGDMQCYWYQRPGYALDDEAVRRLFYDYAYTRRTWRADKLPRYADMESQRQIWERSVLLGIGRRVGGFWYPQLAETE